uniref:Uncharacterized protein n=1 Tax=Glossina pallidipes TaxID=7398 RepID=A0A1B0AEY6_GLOPL
MLRTVFDPVKISERFSLTIQDIGMKFSPDTVIIFLSLHSKNFEFIYVDSLNVKPHHVVDLSALKTISSLSSYCLKELKKVASATNRRVYPINCEEDTENCERNVSGCSSTTPANSGMIILRLQKKMQSSILSPICDTRLNLFEYFVSSD